MYRHKYSYRIAYLIKINFLRKFLYKSQKNFLIGSLNFFFKILVYPFLQLELLALYFVRIYLILYLYFSVGNKAQYIKLG